MTPDEIKALQEKLLYSRKNVYEALDEQAEEEMNVYAEGYKTYLDICKTEREAVLNSIQMAEACDFRPYAFGMPVKAGDKFYYNNRDKELLLFVIGSEGR
ncbi:MAG: aminopeptidase, partial [Clostridia bacterium]|nr:aminopeptidase [Clostridia bacterium]